MDGIKDMVFCGEIVLQVKIARKAAERLEYCKDNFDQVEVWCSIQSILSAAGNVSKILFPYEKKYKERGDRLRKMLNVERDNILQNRNFRNSFFEHYDARIDDWFFNHPTGVYIDLAMNPSFDSNNVNSHRGYNSYNIF